jgi:prepilin-type N-terminal cleavage/methylation domain-containing protein
MVKKREQVMLKSKSFTLLELIIVIVIIGILAVIAIPKFINMRNDAINAAAQGNIMALRSAISNYYSNSAAHNELCTTANPYRSANVGAPCFPSGITELEAMLTSPPTWYNNGVGQCYDGTNIVACP